MTVNEIGSLKTIIKEYGLLKKTVTIQWNSGKEKNCCYFQPF